MAKRGWAACPVGRQWVWQGLGWAAGQSGGAGRRRCGWCTARMVLALWHSPGSVRWCHRQRWVGQPANQVVGAGCRAAAVQRDGICAYRILLAWRGGGFGFQVIRFYRFCHGLRSDVSPHGRGVLRNCLARRWGGGLSRRSGFGGGLGPTPRIVASPVAWPTARSTEARQSA